MANWKKNSKEGTIKKEKLHELFDSLDRNLTELEDLKNEGEEMRNEFEKHELNLYELLKRQAGLIEEQALKIESQNKVIKSILEGLNNIGSDNLFVCDDDDRTIKCCYGCSQRIDTLQQRVLRSLTRDHSKTGFGVKNTDKSDTVDTESSSFDPITTSESALENDMISDTEHSSTNSSQKRKAEQCGVDELALDTESDDEFKFLEEEVVSRPKPIPKPRKLKKVHVSEEPITTGSLIPTRNKTAPKVVPKPIQVKLSVNPKRAPTPLKLGEYDSPIIKTNKVTACKPEIIECAGSRLPNAFVVAGLPVQPMVTQLYTCKRTNRKIEIFNYSILQNSKQVAKACEKYNITKFSYVVSDFENTEIKISSGQIQSLFHSDKSHTVVFLKPNGIGITFKNGTKTETLLVDVENEYHHTWLLVFPKNSREKVCISKVPVDIYIHRCDVAEKKGRGALVREAEIAQHESNKNCNIVTSFDTIRVNMKKPKDKRRVSN